MLGAIALVFFATATRGARPRLCRRRRLVPRQLHAREGRGLGLRGDVGLGSRAERVVVITAGLVLAPIGVWLLVAAIYSLRDGVAHGRPADPVRPQATAERV